MYKMPATPAPIAEKHAMAIESRWNAWGTIVCGLLIMVICVKTAFDAQDSMDLALRVVGASCGLFLILIAIPSIRKRKQAKEEPTNRPS
jgi:threonine/homoserine/homoserine lactone efflux protein